MSTRVLIVDDQLDLIESLERRLRKMRYDVIGATGGREALAHLTGDDQGFDLLITDYRMPDMSGMDLLKTLRKEGILLPVVMMTGYGNKALLKDFINCGGNGYIEKPFRVEDIAKTISQALKGYTKPGKNDARNKKGEE